MWPTTDCTLHVRVTYVFYDLIGPFSFWIFVVKSPEGFLRGVEIVPGEFRDCAHYQVLARLDSYGRMERAKLHVFLGFSNVHLHTSLLGCICGQL